MKITLYVYWRYDIKDLMYESENSVQSYRRRNIERHWRLSLTSSIESHKQVQIFLEFLDEQLFYYATWLNRTDLMEANHIYILPNLADWSWMRRSDRDLTLLEIHEALYNVYKILQIVLVLEIYLLE